MDNIREKLVELIRDSTLDFPLACYIADHLIANGVTVQEWIPVSEPPKECGRYYTNRKISGGDHVEILQYGIDSDGGYWSCYDDEYGVRLVRNVTHWMPLPTPPKQEG